MPELRDMHIPKLRIWEGKVTKGYFTVEDIRGVVKAVCVSDVRGVPKHPVGEARLIEGFGIEGDAHAGRWHRQVSLLSYEKIQDFNARGAGVSYGDFGENIVVEGIDVSSLPVGTVLRTGDSASLKITQIGKECHSRCAIYDKMGECIMPAQGVFAEVTAGGAVRPSDMMTVKLPCEKAFTAAVITLSDKAFRGEREDKSGPEAAGLLREAGYEVVETLLLADEPEQLKCELCRLADERLVDLIITSGGTGFSLRDRTPEATLAVADRSAPGIAEYIRARSMEITPRAMLGRGVSVIRGTTLIINLPGSPKAVRESLGFIMDTLEHGLKILRGTASECAR